MNAPGVSAAFERADWFETSLRKIAGRELKGGNRLSLLLDGPQAHEAQLQAIADAQHHVHLETYLLTDDELGTRYAEVLQQRARAGVKVRLMLDGLGASGAGDEYRDSLRQAGVELREFNSINPFKNPRVWRMTRRSHRKTLIVDGRVAFTGGVNITDEYRRSPDDPTPAVGSERGWRDTQMMIEGPAVAEFQQMFLMYWARLGALRDEDGCYRAEPVPDAQARVCAITDQGEDFVDHLITDAPPAHLMQLRPKYRVEPRIYHAYLSAIRLARERIWITQAYFAPNGRLIRALAAAARRGVDVRLLLPGSSDVPLVRYAGRRRYARLLRAGVRIWEYQQAMLHAKTAAIDGVWATVGSSNLDYRSLFHNDEANAFIVDATFAHELERVFEHDLRHAIEIQRAQWKRRGWFDRLMELFAGSIKRLL